MTANASDYRDAATRDDLQRQCDVQPTDTSYWRRAPRPEIYLIAQERLKSGHWTADPEAGVVYSTSRGGPTGSIHPETGYVRLLLKDTLLGVNTTIAAHRVLWEFVHGAIPMGLFINHKNSIRHDNRICNLELVTTGQNVRHSIAFGNKVMDQKGEKNWNAKLTTEDVLNMREDFDTRGLSFAALARKYGTTQSNARLIVLRKSWKWL